MKKIDEDFLISVGLKSIPESQKAEFLAFIQEELELRIGERISRGVPEERLNEFDHLTSRDEIEAWLNENCPNYRQLVEQSIADLENELRNSRDELLAALTA